MLTSARIFLSLLFLTLAAPTVGQSSSTEGRHYPDGHGGEVFFPMGDASFADEMVEFNVGDPQADDSIWSKPRTALGPPDWVDDPEQSTAVTLGCAGDLLVAMTDNSLIDIAGPDLYVFEIGPDVEPTALAISEDGESWTRVGRISGGKAKIDIAPYIEPGASFRYIKLVDLMSSCGTRTPGAEIDAVGAIGSAEKFSLDSAVLFDSGEYRLKPGAHEALESVIAAIDKPATTRIEVAGHTDSVGSESSNQALSENRARSVADFLIDEGGFGDRFITTRAYGESRPVADNDTRAGRARNRRVELTVRTVRENEAAGGKRIEILGVWDAGEHGIMELRRVDGEVRGDYTLDNGAILGEFTSDIVFEGYWVEDDSRRTCDTRKDDREHWGHLRIEFETPDRDRFQAHWRYCGETEDRGSWRGNLSRLL